MITNAMMSYEYRGLSTDDKSKIDGGKIANGSVFLEMDTEKVYIYNAQSKEWKEI